MGTELLARATKAQLPRDQTFLAEPAGRNTMAAVCWGAWEIHRHDPDASVIALPADAHVAGCSPRYRATLYAAQAFEIAEQNGTHRLPWESSRTFAATGYGYIQKGDTAFDR